MGVNCLRSELKELSEEFPSNEELNLTLLLEKLLKCFDKVIR